LYVYTPCDIPPCEELYLRARREVERKIEGGKKKKEKIKENKKRRDIRHQA